MLVRFYIFAYINSCYLCFYRLTTTHITMPLKALLVPVFLSSVLLLWFVLVLVLNGADGGNAKHFEDERKRERPLRGAVPNGRAAGLHA